MSFWLLLICVVGISNGAVGLVCFYEKDVQDRVVELGLISKEKLKRNTAFAGAALWLADLFAVPAMVYGINGASGFTQGFMQMFIIYMIMNIFDRLFIDVYWVGHTKTWIIPGTEDLMPYIPLKVHIKKWVGTIMLFSIVSAAIAGLMQLFMK
ncbi:MAG: hypothetical protein IIY78_09145 [Clostridia bacterium]|nr:hypothetical protein [Clostridia bacterium]